MKPFPNRGRSISRMALLMLPPLLIALRVANPVLADFRTYGFDGIVAKPFQVAQLAQVLQQAITASP